MATTLPPEATSRPHDGEPSSATVLQDELEALERRFVGHDDDELMMRLKELVRQHITRPQPDG